MPLSSHKSHILTLPIELIIKTFDALDFRALLSCQQVCRLFRTLVCDTVSLRYTIELAAAGQENGPPNAVSAAIRLDKLKRQQAAWNTLKWAHDQRIPMLPGGAWELFGGVLAQSGGGGRFTFKQLPSHSRSVNEKEWTIECHDVNVRDFGMDPSQDLLVILERPSWSDGICTHRVHLRTMSTGAPHPLAPNPATLSHIQEVRNMHVSYAIQVSANHLGVLIHGFNLNENELLIWEWKAGCLEMFLADYEIRDFAFLSDRHIITTVLYVDEPQIFIWDFQSISSQKVNIDESEYVCSFSFPVLHARASPVDIAIRSDPSPAWAPSVDIQAPFFTSQGNRLYVVTFWVQVGNAARCIILFAPLSTFVSHLNALDPGVMRNTFDWEAWGVEGTRMILPPQLPSTVWVCYVFGSKYVAPRLYGHRSDPPLFVHVYDFNQLAFKRGYQMGGHNPEDPELTAPDLMHGGSDVPMTFVTTPTVLESREKVFKDVVQTRLPYRFRSLPIGSSSVSDEAVMCSEDNLIIVDDHQREYRILTF